MLNPNGNYAPRRAACLTRLTLTGFRNYDALRLELSGAPVVLVGPNGAGKTNLMEAVSLFTPGRGLRGAQYGDLARLPQGRRWAVAAHLEGPLGQVRLGTAWERSADAGADDEQAASRQVVIDAKPARGSGAFGEHLRVLWLTPAMDRLFTGPAADRRKFLDRLVQAFDPDHGARVGALDKALRERNRLLADRAGAHGWLSAIEQQLAEAAVAVAAARVAAIEALRAYLGEAPSGRRASAFPAVELALEGDIEARLASVPAVQVEDEYRKMLHDSRKLDCAAGRTLKGPHRSDLAVTHAGRGMAARACSTGEQKALLIGLVLAHARAVRDSFAGWAPLVLLDEVTAHLDGERRAGLFGELAHLGAQAWMSGTDGTLFAAMGQAADVVTIEAGAITRLATARNSGQVT
jgi:DNA replication and repair protein RecF